MTSFHRPAAGCLALVGDRSPHVASHNRIPALLEALRRQDGLALDAYWMPTEEVEDAADDGGLDGFDGFWLLPGSPYRSEAGALAAVRTARERAIPFLGTCAGFQHALLEFARHVGGVTGAAHAETTPNGEELVIVPLACSLAGHEGAVQTLPGSLAEQILGADRRVERYHCSYGANPVYLDALRAHGLRFTGVDDDGQVRIAELADHPFFFATLFQPELAGDGSQPHSIIRALAAAVVEHASVGVAS
jgi:CTP synthase (UTP-ammonia lyase)